MPRVPPRRHLLNQYKNIVSNRQRTQPRAGASIKAKNYSLINHEISENINATNFKFRSDRWTPSRTKSLFL